MAAIALEPGAGPHALPANSSSPISPGSPRVRTREDIFQLICTRPNMTRTAIVELTGLPPSTVAHAVTQLIAAGRVRRTHATKKGPGSGAGRPAAVLNAVTPRATIGTIEVTPDRLRVGLGDSTGRITGLTLGAGGGDKPGEMIRSAVRTLKGACIEHAIDNLEQIVVGIPANPQASRLSSARLSTANESVDPAALVDALRFFEVPVRVEDTAVLAALGELRKGAGAGHRNIVHVQASTEIRAALVVDGLPYRGATGRAGDIAHLRVQGSNRPCACGAVGCLAAVASAGAVRTEAARLDPRQHEDVQGSLDLDPRLRAVLQDAGAALGTVLADVARLLNPNLIIVGGELGAIGMFVEGVRESVTRLAGPTVTQVLPGQLGLNAGIVGALVSAAPQPLPVGGIPPG